MPAQPPPAHGESRSPSPGDLAEPSGSAPPFRTCLVQLEESSPAPGAGAGPGLGIGSGVRRINEERQLGRRCHTGALRWLCSVFQQGHWDRAHPCWESFSKLVGG